MAKYRVDSEYRVDTIEADALQRDAGYLILVKDEQIIAVFSRWNSVVQVGE